MSSPTARPTALADLRPGDRITRVHDRRTGTWYDLPAPALVTDALAPVWGELGGPDGVRLHSVTEVEHVLYPDFVDQVAATHDRGHTTRDAATRAARKAAGWTVRGGHYYRPDPAESNRIGYVQYAYAGFQGADTAGARFATWQWIVRLGDRWYVTARPAAWAVNAANRMTAAPDHLALAAARAMTGSWTRTDAAQYVGA